VQAPGETGLATRTLTLTIRYAGFETHTRSKTLGEPTRLDSDIFAVYQELFRIHRDVKRKVRLLGVSLSGLTHGGEQLDLLDAERRANWKSSPAPRTASATALVSAKCNSGFASPR